VEQFAQPLGAEAELPFAEHVRPILISMIAIRDFRFSQL